MVAMQGGLFGGVAVTGSIKDKVAYILEQYPEARDDYKLLVLRYWQEIDGLNVDTMDAAAFQAWLLQKATSWKTLQNRAMEVQNERPELEASPEVEKQREIQSRAGPIGAY
jgi:hypothetical protein